MTNIKKLTNHILYVLDQNKMFTTPLKLQKILYYTLKYAIDNHLYTKSKFENIYDLPFHVWRDGPVIPEIYEAYKIYGSDPITVDGKHYPEFDKLNPMIVYYNNKDVFDLINKSESAPFYQLWKSRIPKNSWRSNITYDLDDIQ